jgi:hypothetical protein
VKGDDEEVRPKSSNKRGGDDEIKSFRSALENAASLLEEVDMNQDFERFILYGRNWRSGWEKVVTDKKKLAEGPPRKKNTAFHPAPDPREFFVFYASLSKTQNGSLKAFLDFFDKLKTQLRHVPSFLNLTLLANKYLQEEDLREVLELIDSLGGIDAFKKAVSCHIRDLQRELSAPNDLGMLIQCLNEFFGGGDQLIAAAQGLSGVCCYNQCFRGGDFAA